MQSFVIHIFKKHFILLKVKLNISCFIITFFLLQLDNYAKLVDLKDKLETKMNIEDKKQLSK